jgi:hypothetical protein
MPKKKGEVMSFFLNRKWELKSLLRNKEWVIIVVYRELENSLMCIVKKYLENYLYSRANS